MCIVDLGSIHRIRRVSISFQGGGGSGGIYFPAQMEAYGSTKVLPIEDIEWNDKLDISRYSLMKLKHISNGVCRFTNLGNNDEQYNN